MRRVARGPPRERANASLAATRLLGMRRQKPLKLQKRAIHQRCDDLQVARCQRTGGRGQQPFANAIQSVHDIGRAPVAHPISALRDRLQGLVQDGQVRVLEQRSARAKREGIDHLDGGHCVGKEDNWNTRRGVLDRRPVR